MTSTRNRRQVYCSAPSPSVPLYTPFLCRSPHKRVVRASISRDQGMRDTVPNLHWTLLVLSFFQEITLAGD
jgi:hypothetical protein